MARKKTPPPLTADAATMAVYEVLRQEITDYSGNELYNIAEKVIEKIIELQTERGEPQ